MTLLTFFEHEVVIEYERAIRAIFDNKKDLKKNCKFNIIAMSSILNQFVFMRESLVHRKMLAMQERSMYESMN